jgi:surface protein
VSHVTEFYSMFSGATAFNQPLNSWDVSSALSMSNMFDSLTGFNQPLDSWDVSNVTNMYNIFRNSALSVGNYSNILADWSQRTLQSGLDLTLIGPNGDLTPYCDTVQAARDTITTTFNWDITDGGSVPCLLLSYTVDGNATLVGNGSQRVVSGEDGASVEVVPNAGYRFVSWSDARTDNPRIDTNVATSVAVTAILEPDPSNTGGGSSGSQSTRVSQCLEQLQTAVASSTESIVVTMTTFVHSVKEFIDYLFKHEDVIDTLSQEERKTLIIFMRDLLIKLITFIPGF